MPSAQRGPARSNMAVGAGGYINRAKANSVFSWASDGTGKSLYSMAGYSRNWRWKAQSDPASSVRAPATSQCAFPSLSMKEAPCFLANIHRQGAPQHRSLELRARQCASGETGQKVGEHGVTAGRPDNAVDSRGIRQQKLLEPNAVRQLVADFLLPRALVAAQLSARKISGPDRVHGGARGELASDHGVIDSLRGECVH